MQNNDILSTFQKHIGSIEGMQDITPAVGQKTSESLSAKHIHRFGEDIKGANEFIGAMQSASVALKKILKLAQNIDLEHTQDLQISQAKGEIEQIIQNASFISVPLFDTELETRFNGEHYRSTIENPMPLFKTSQDIPTLIAYLEEKNNEITQMLLKLSDALTEPTFSPSSQTSQYDFNHFNAQDFTRLFKGQ